MLDRPLQAVPRPVRRVLMQTNERLFRAPPVFRAAEELWWLAYLRRIRRLERTGDLKLHIGSGPRLLDGWVNVDIWCVPQILVMRMPGGLRRFRTGSVSFIYSSHFFEHLRPTTEAPAFLAECRRILVPGGTMRIVVPDIEPIVRAYVADDTEFFRAQAAISPAWCVTPMDFLSYAVNQDDEHKHGYDYETLARMLRNAGFEGVQRMDYNQSSHPELRVDYTDDVYPPTGKSLSLMVEATSPGRVITEAPAAEAEELRVG